jgi:hypothetical protein
MRHFNTGYRCGHILKTRRATKSGRRLCRLNTESQICPICKILNRAVGSNRRPLTSAEKHKLEQLKSHVVVWVG